MRYSEHRVDGVKLKLPNELVYMYMERFPNGAGYLELIMGPMYAGKTSRLMNIKKQLSLCGFSCIVINHAHDTRYETKATELQNHDQVTINCVAAGSLYEQFPLSKDGFKFEAVLINEAQFFPDIVEWTKEAVSAPNNKYVVLSGLDGDFNRKPFGRWLDLVPYADKIEKLTSICAACRAARAMFTKRKEGFGKDLVVIDDHAYEPVCRLCYDSKIIGAY